MQDPPRELSSWKEIAAYLGVSVRTAQNWEAEKQLPITRLGPRGRILATTAGLDAWKQSNLQGTRRTNGYRFLRWYAAGLTAVLLIALAAAAVHSIRESRRRPTGYRIDPGRFVVVDASGRELWNVQEPELAGRETYGYVEGKGNRAAWFGDLDGDGLTEVLFVPILKPEAGRIPGPLICFSQDGRERWRFSPGRAISTSTESFEPPFAVVNFAVAARRIVVEGQHRFFYPAQVAVVSPEGKLLREYWHAGHLPALAVSDFDGDGASEIYAAGVNNARKMATLVVLDPERMAGAADERGTPAYQFRGLAPGVEKARILFPRSCLTNVKDIWNFAQMLALDKHDLTVTVSEDPHDTGAALFYHLDRSLRLKNLTPGDGFEMTHSRFRAEGKLDHDMNQAELDRLREVVYVSGGPVPGELPPR